jgi:hypothetical protein
MIHPGFVAPARARERFLREVQAISLLDHPNICPVHDAGDIDGVPYLAMRYVEGETLAERIARQRATGATPDVDEVLSIGECIARALHAAHEKGLVHRDVKPDNVMLETGGQALLLDFGLAQLEDGVAPRLTRPGDQVGTPAYMAPEQIAGQPSDRRTDVYALGATLYEALTGRLPHEAPTREALYRRILGADVSHAGRHNRSVPPELDIVLSTAMDREPGRRYATAGELADDLRRVRERRPIRARPPALLLRARRWTQRNPAVASMGMATVLVAGLGLWLLRALYPADASTAVLDGPRLQPVWSTYFGGDRRDECVVVRLGPRQQVTIAGHSSSRGLATPGAWQTAIAGAGNDTDAFVARFDPNLPAGRQLVWCTYLGGTGLELVFDAEVDPVTGITTVVGMTRSADFPPQRSLKGSSDGFIVQLDADGSRLISSGLIGGSGDDRLCEVEIGNGRAVMVAGVTESGDLTANVNAYCGGATDAFVAQLAPDVGSGVLWTRYLGGSAEDGRALSSWVGLGPDWEGNLDRMAMTLAPAGRIAVVTQSTTTDVPALTTVDAAQSVPAGLGDVYLALLDPDDGELSYGTFFGGKWDETPRAIAVHPDGGYVLGGTTWSPDLPVTPGCYQSENHGGVVQVSDAFLCWIDPDRGAGARRYSTYLGGEGGEDNVIGLAMDPTGVVAVAGVTGVGGFPVTRYLCALRARYGYGGTVARLSLAGRGERDLLGSTVFATTAATTTSFHSVVVGEDGGLWITGATNVPDLPLCNAHQAANAGGREGVILHLPRWD